MKIPINRNLLSKAALFVFALTNAVGSWAVDPTQIIRIGAIEDITLDTPGDMFSGGTITIGGRMGTTTTSGIGGTTVIIPRNLLIDLPANRLTLSQMFSLAPPACLANGDTGLAGTDAVCEGGTVGVATILAVSDVDDRLIAGEVFIEKGQESISGKVTFMQHRNGFFRINGDGTNNILTGGTMIRINDPTMRYTIQRAAGCRPADNSPNNCSPDERFGVDPDNYTITFTTGYPACIPSRLTVADNPHMPSITRTVGSNNAGLNDPLCDDDNRQGIGDGNPVDVATVFAPIQVGDHISASGNFERIRGRDFFSAHTVTVADALTTSGSQVDYMTWAEVEWDTTGFQNERIRMLMIAFTTRANAHVDVFSLHVNPTTGANEERRIASTLGCELSEGAGKCLNQGVPGTGAGIAKINYDVDFPKGPDDRRSPCLHLNAIGEGAALGCSPTPNYTLAQEAAILVPITRELIGRTDSSIVGVTTDIDGQTAPNGQYLTPVGIGHPEFGEIDLERTAEPFIFTGQNWTLDRRLGPGGCEDVAPADGLCDATTPQTLDPYPFSCRDPAAQTLPPGGLPSFRSLILSFLGGGGGSVEPVYDAINLATACPP